MRCVCGRDFSVKSITASRNMGIQPKGTKNSFSVKNNGFCSELELTQQLNQITHVSAQR